MASEVTRESLKIGKRHPIAYLAIVEGVSGLCQTILSIHKFQCGSFSCLVTRDVLPQALRRKGGRAAERREVFACRLRFFIGGANIFHQLPAGQRLI